MAATVRSSTKNQATTATTSASVNKPAGCVSGDVVYLFFALGNNDGTTNTTPTGFTVLSGPDTNTNNVTSYVYRRVCDGSEGASFTSTISTSQRYSYIAVCVQGADATTPEAATTTNTVYAGADTASHVAPTISPSVTNTLLLCGFCTPRQSGVTIAYTAPGSMTELQDIAVSDDVGYMVASEAIAASGATGTRTATMTGGTNNKYNAYSVSVQGVAAVVATPSAVAGVTTVPAPTVTASGVPTPSRVNGVASVPTPNLSASQVAARVDAVASVPTPSIVVGVTVTPVRVDATAAVGTTTVTASGSATATRVDAVATVLTPGFASTPVVLRVDAVATVGAPALSSSLTAVTVAAVAAQPAVLIVLSQTEEGATVQAVAIIPTPTITASSTPTPDAVTAVAIVPSASPVESESILLLIGPTTPVGWVKEQPDNPRRAIVRIAGPTPTGMTVYRVDGVWKAGTNLRSSEINAADIVHLGGHEFTATYTGYLAMVDDGVTPEIVQVLA